MSERVTAIITTYKRSAEIVKRAAESVLNQTYENIDLIIVDDSPAEYECRTDVCRMAASLGDRVHYIQHEKNMGACAARNTGIKAATGAFLAFLDDDDEWLPTKIEKQLQVMRNNEKSGLVYCGRYTYNTSNKKETEQKIKFIRGKVYKKLILENFIGSTSFPLIRKDVIEESGGFDVKMKAAQDYELWLRIAKITQIDFTPEPLVRYFVHEGEQITKNDKNKIDGLERLNQKNMDYLKKHPKAYSIRILRTIINYAQIDMKEAEKMFFKAVRIWPIPSVELLRAVKWLYVMPVLERRK